MMESVADALGPLITTVSWTLIHSLWQGAVISLLLAVVLAVHRSRSARLRYGLACGALLMLTLTVAVTAVTITGSHTPASKRTTGEFAIAMVSPAGVSPAAAATADPGKAGTTVRSEQQAGPVFTQYVFGIWLIGLVVLSFYNVAGWHRARAMARIGALAVPTSWQQVCTALALRLNIRHSVTVVQSAAAKVPCVIGWLRPVLLLPISAFTGLTDDQIRMLLAHELAHIQRHDVMVNYLQLVLETVLFCNPAVWWISRAIRIEREFCCDDIAVAISGDRLGYARTLTDLEHLRATDLSPALGVNGGSLLMRVRRLFEPATPRSTHGHASLAALATVAAVVALYAGLIGGVTTGSATAEPLTAETSFTPERDDIKGHWSIDSDNDEIQLELKFPDGWSTTRHLYAEDLVEPTGQSDQHFSMGHDAGTFHFVGTLERDRNEYFGRGQVHFRSNPDYINTMQDYGYRIRPGKGCLKMAVHNVSLEFVRGLSEAGYADMSLDELVEMRIHDVTPEYIASLEALGMSHIRRNRLVEMRIHRVDADFVGALAELGYTNLSPSRLVEMRIHNVDPDFVGELASLGYRDIDPGQLVAMSIHNVTPDYVSQLAELGYTNISSDDLVSMRIHKVTPRFVRQLADLGYTDVDSEDLVAMRIHNVTPDFIESMADRGYEHVSPQRLIEYKIHGLPRRASH
ncbi:MAG: M56 family metallopeptidase [candidate division Zixibacteria bacterium]|nr:M56 family metallopeptidase [candidate division Zixibacteria bacterium]